MWWRKREEDKKIIPFIVITEQLFCGTPKRFRKLATQKVCLFLSVPMTDFSSVSNFVVILFSICWFWGHAKYLQSPFENRSKMGYCFPLKEYWNSMNSIADHMGNLDNFVISILTFFAALKVKGFEKAWKGPPPLELNFCNVPQNSRVVCVEAF